MIVDVIPPATLGVMTVSRATVFVRDVMTVRSVIVLVIPATAVMETVISAVILLRADVLLVRVVVLPATVVFHRPAIVVLALVRAITVVVVILRATGVKVVRTVPLRAIHILNLVLRETFVLTGLAADIVLVVKGLVLPAMVVILVLTVLCLINIVQVLMAVLPVKVIALAVKVLVQEVAMEGTGLVLITAIPLLTLSVLIATIDVMALMPVRQRVNRVNIATGQQLMAGLAGAVRDVLTVIVIATEPVMDVILHAMALVMVDVIQDVLLTTELVRLPAMFV